MIYGGKRDSTLVALDPRLIVREMHRGGWRSHLYEVKAGGVTERALMREIQLHPVSDKPIHVDFHRIAAGEPVHVAVSVAFTGAERSVGIKRGGTLNIDYHVIEVSADPDRIPEHLEADIAGLDIGAIIHWTDLKGTEGLTLLHHEPDMVVATIAAPTLEPTPSEDEAPVQQPGDTPAETEATEQE